ncbi:hypothetical protein EVJ33_04835 [Exiguobacterium sp. SL-10]|uniref:hypothetical protein n=1 Tax=unclassified Exiguobacterium TaxID=2644629 RepID=UPI00103EFC9D|nr:MULTISPECIES: hypothetical protein [unclassified Exiguobacterium]TCI22960.1 hypothetical protein EVJ34_00660 [Exiguobacterium sp. SL-9]TCI30628.1 hypothetical protein EVJ33_04835 [Exiguobacterium sp. SL-10]
MIEQEVIFSSLGDEEVERQLFTTDGASKQAMLLARADATQLRTLQDIDVRYIRIGYDNEGSWLAIDLGNGEVFSCDDEYNLVDVIRTPLETILNWPPTAERLLLLTQRLNHRELSKEELPRKRNVPKSEEMIEWMLYVKAGVVTRENVSDWAGHVLNQSEDEMIERTALDGLILLSGIDLLDNEGHYLHREQDLDDWIEQLRKRMRQHED